jgi:ATP-binding cassette subfamily C protein CydD
MWPRLLLSRYPGPRKFLYLSIATSAVAAAVLVIWTLLLARAIDIGFLRGTSVTPLFFALGGLLLVRGALLWIAERLAQSSSSRLRSESRSDLVASVIRSGPATIGNERVGEIGSVIGGGIDSLDRYVAAFLPATALAGIVPIAIFALVAILDPWTALILLFTGPMLIALLAVIGGRTRVLAQHRFDELGWLSAFYLDMIRGLPTLKAFGRAHDGADSIEVASRRFGETTMEVLRTAFQTSLVIEWAATTATALVAVQVSFRMIDGDISFVTALSVLMLTPEFFAPLRRLAVEYHSGQDGNAALARIDGIGLASMPDPVRPRISPMKARELLRSPGVVEFHNVSFRHAPDRSCVIDHLDLRLEAGTSVVLLGPSGAGKSTIASLLLGFRQPDAGRITVAGTDLADIDGDDWRKHVSYVPQNPSLFSGTIAENIALARPDATAAEVRAAADVAQATGFIEQFPDGFETLLGEQGLRLSGGQRQRLAIARAALRDAPFVILDEFTANLDPETEQIVISAVREITRGKTALLIAHRSATIAAADRIIRLDAGRITEIRT